MSASAKDIDQATISEICSYVEKRIGVHLGPRQHAMVQGRLRRRMFELQIATLQDYRSYLARNKREMEMLLSLLTTHYTYFFREFVQFEELEANLPALVRRAKERGSNRIDILSAGCSRGQEVYSLAMHLKKHLGEIAPGMDFRIHGTDVDPESVKVAANGVYKHDDIKAVPATYIDTHWARGTGEISAYVKAKKSIRDHCHFSVLNLLELKVLEGRKFDAIFCRNVFIYFTAEQVAAVTRELVRHLHSGGLLFVGLTESLHGAEVPFRSVGPSVYGRRDDFDADEKTVQIRAALPPKPVPNPLKVVCIDDSPSILTILQSVFGPDSGFQVVGVARNGDEGMEIIKKVRPDVVTLDIHMPVCDGIQFLRRFGKTAPPVVVVSSVSREDAGLAFESLQLGAADYVEKPALNNLEQRADELRAKLKSAYRGRHSPRLVTPVDVEFKRTLKIEHPEQCARILLFSLADQERCRALVAQLSASRVPLFLAIEGANSVLPEVSVRMATSTGLPFQICEAGVKGAHFLGDWQTCVTEVARRAFSGVSVLVLGEASEHAAKSLPDLKGAQLILEDLGEGRGTSAFTELASYVVPVTSFIYHSDEFLAGVKRAGS
jgi:chemotaxis protein methyltransferase CheR